MSQSPTSNTAPNKPSSNSRNTTLLAGAALALVLGTGGMYAVRRAHGVRGMLALITSGTGDLNGVRGAHGRRTYISIGAVANNSGTGGDELRTSAQSGIQEALDANDSVTTEAPTAAASRGARNVARGHVFDANVQSIRVGDNSVRIAVSVVVSSYPGRAYEFESSSAITITGGSATNPSARADGVRTAMRSATRSALQQIAAGVP